MYRVPGPIKDEFLCSDACVSEGRQCWWWSKEKRHFYSVDSISSWNIECELETGRGEEGAKEKRGKAVLKKRCAMVPFYFCHVCVGAKKGRVIMRMNTCLAVFCCQQPETGATFTPMTRLKELKQKPGKICVVLVRIPGDNTCNLTGAC